MLDSEVKQLAHAMAKANGHPHPLEWAESVLAHFKETIEADVAAVETKVEGFAHEVVSTVESVFATDAPVAADQGEPHVEQ